MEQKNNLQNKKQKKSDNTAYVEKNFSWKTFIFKILAIFSIVVAAVIFTDKKEYFVSDQSNNHTGRKWRSFYRFAEKQHKNADIVVFGNSHASAGVEPYIVSMATNSYCFILNASGGSLMDSYFNLKEILRVKNRPKLLIIETAFLDKKEDGGAEWSRYQSFEARNNLWEKLKMMPTFFTSDEFVNAWSPTVRNHNYLLTDRERLKINADNVGKEKNPDRVPLDLGRFSHGSNALKGENLAKYDSVAPFKCADYKFSASNKKYLNKIADLCRENNITMLFFTVPTYPKVYDNYEIYRQKLQTVIDEYPQAKWLNLQQPLDTALFTLNAFNNEYNAACHTTYYGMTVATYKLCDFLAKNYPNLLPDRSKDVAWLTDFYQQPHFLFIQDLPNGIAGCYAVAKNSEISGFSVRELLAMPNNDSDMLILKLFKNRDLPDTLNVILKLRQGDQIVTVPLAMTAMTEVLPPAHKVYVAGLHKGLTVLDIEKIQ